MDTLATNLPTKSNLSQEFEFLWLKLEHFKNSQDSTSLCDMVELYVFNETPYILLYFWIVQLFISKICQFNHMTKISSNERTLRKIS